MYALRHSSIVRGLRAMLPVRLVAALHDTSVAMIEQHYSAYIVDATEDLAGARCCPLRPIRRQSELPRRASLENAMAIQSVKAEIVIHSLGKSVFDETPASTICIPKTGTTLVYSARRSA